MARVSFAHDLCVFPFPRACPNFEHLILIGDDWGLRLLQVQFRRSSRPNQRAGEIPPRFRCRCTQRSRRSGTPSILRFNWGNLFFPAYSEGRRYSTSTKSDPSSPTHRWRACRLADQGASSEPMSPPSPSRRATCPTSWRVNFSLRPAPNPSTLPLGRVRNDRALASGAGHAP